MIHSAGQDLLNQQVHIGTCDAGTQTNGIDHRRPLESDPDLGLSGPGGYHEPNVTRFGDNHGSQADSFALTLFRPSQHDDPQIEQLTVDQGLQEVLLGEHTHLIEEINQENILLRSQRDDLLYQCAGLESDLSTSFVEKMDLEEELKSAEKTIEKGRALYERSEAERKETHSKLENMTRLFEANTENEKIVEMLEQQKLLDEENTWILGQLQMKTEDNRYFAVQREAVVRATEYDRVCAMTAEIENLRQRLSTFQAQLAESDTAKLRLSAELQQERINHRATRKAIESKYKMGSSPSHLQQTAYAGGSAPQKPSKFTPTYTIASEAPLPKAGTSPPSYSEQNSEYMFGAVGDTPKEYGTRSKSKFSFGDNTVPKSTQSKSKFSFGDDNVPESTRSKSKFSFGDNTVPESTSSATGTTTGAAPRTDFNFTFGGTTDHHRSPSGYGNTTGPELPNDSTSPANIFLASGFSADAEQTASPPSPGNPKLPLFKAECPQYFEEFNHGSRAQVEKLHDPYFAAGGSYINSNPSVEVTDNVGLFGGLGLKMPTENCDPHNFAKPANVHINQQATKGAKKPLASDFFDDEEPVEAEVEPNSKDALTTEQNSEEKVTIVSAESGVTQQTHIENRTSHNATAQGNIQTSIDTTTTESPQATPPLSPSSNPEIPSPPSKVNPAKEPKNKGKTSKRALLRKAAKERKKAPIGEADWSGSS